LIICGHRVKNSGIWKTFLDILCRCACVYLHTCA